MIRGSTTRILQRMGFTVLGAVDGAEALRVFDEHATAIGLVLLDVKMPVMGGAECLRLLRERSRVPVLIATGYAVDEEAQAMLARGATSLIDKPFTIEQLTLEIRQLLPGESTPPASIVSAAR